ncbi:uncharacterized protein [Apostichopus japonicus]|uniref:uncharacterized protein isoform X2 n=1 Tax=Stichopus japonicus TaxID=307972 RepID=UPI003AB67228
MEASIYVYFQVFLILNMAYSVNSAGVFNYRKAVNGSVLLNVCHNETDHKIGWKFQDKFLTFEGLLVRNPLSESLHLLHNKSLYIQPISLLNIGKYECTKNRETLLTYFLDVEVPPTLSMTVDGHSYHDNGDTLYIPHNKTIPVSCSATGSRPVVNLSITVDNEEISPSDSNTTTNAILNGTFFDTRIVFALLTAEETGNLTCYCSGLSYYLEQRLEVSYSTYVFLESVGLTLRRDNTLMQVAIGFQKSGKTPSKDLDFVVPRNCHWPSRTFIIHNKQILLSHHQLLPEEDNLKSDRKADDVLRPLVPKALCQEKVYREIIPEEENIRIRRNEVITRRWSGGFGSR